MTALFESVSGITVTGATIYSDVESLPEAINLWRFMLHFIGGIGIITIAILVLPTLRVGGMQLFRTENSDKSEKLLPRISQVLAVFSLMCIAFIVYISFLLKMAGMSNFDAICHSISAIMTGGFSTKNNGIAYYDNRLIEFIVAVAMFFGGLTFMEIINCFKNGVKHFYKNQQIRGYIKLFFFSVLTVAFLYFIKNNNGISLKVFIGFVFQVASSITTTGYDLIASNVDSIAKGAAPCMKFLFIVLLAIGGCSGSTSSGIKIFRLQIIWGILKNHIKKQIKPNHVNTVEYYEQVVDGQVIVSVVSFLSLLAISFFVSTFLICLINQYDISVGLAATFSCIFNSGYPVEFLTSLQIPYSDMNGLTKLILMIDMLVGRLEFISVFVILSLKFWKK
jgi:trk system potassium uptake protein TrkH